MRGKVFPFGDLRGGLNTRDSAYQIEPNQARDLLNVTGSVNGAVRKRDGMISFAALTNALNGAIGVEATATRHIFAADAVAGLFRSITTGGVASSAGAPVAVGAAPWSFIQAPANGGQGPVYGMNGATAVAWDGTTAVGWTAASGTLPLGKYLVSFGNRVFVAGMTAYAGVADPGSTLVFSDLGNPRAWPAANYVAFDPNDGDQITGLGTLGPYLLVFKRKKVFLVYDLNTGANRRLADGTGCAAFRSIVETAQGTFFLADRGVYVCNGERVELVSDIVTPTIQSVLPANIGLAAGTFHDNHYYLAVSTTGAANNVLLDFDTQLGSWWMHSGAFSQLLVWRPSTQPLLYGIDTTPRVSRLFVPATPTDYGLAMVAYWTGAWLAPNSPVSRKRLRAVRADISGHLQLNLAADFAGAPSLVEDFDLTASTSTFGSGTFGGEGTFGDPAVTAQIVAPTPMPGLGRSFSLQWYSNHDDAWQLEAFELLMSDRRN